METILFDLIVILIIVKYFLIFRKIINMINIILRDIK